MFKLAMGILLSKTQDKFGYGPHTSSYRSTMAPNVILISFCIAEVNMIVLYLSRSGEQPEQRVLAHKSEQPTAGFRAIFHIKHGGIITNLNI